MLAAYHGRLRLSDVSDVLEPRTLREYALPDSWADRELVLAPNACPLRSAPHALFSATTTERVIVLQAIPAEPERAHSQSWLIVREALVQGPWHDLERRSRTHRRTPMDWDAEHILLRTVRCVSGTVELVMNCEPAFDYHRIPATWEYSAQAYGEAIARASRDADAHPTLRLTTNLRLGLEGHEARARTRMKEGDNAFVALSWSKHPAPQTYE